MTYDRAEKLMEENKSKAQEKGFNSINEYLAKIYSPEELQKRHQRKNTMKDIGDLSSKLPYSKNLEETVKNMKLEDSGLKMQGNGFIVPDNYHSEWLKNTVKTVKNKEAIPSNDEVNIANDKPAKEAIPEGDEVNGIMELAGAYGTGTAATNETTSREGYLNRKHETIENEKNRRQEVSENKKNRTQNFANELMSEGESDFNRAASLAQSGAQLGKINNSSDIMSM